MVNLPFHFKRVRLSLCTTRLTFHVPRDELLWRFVTILSNQQNVSLPVYYVQKWLAFNSALFFQRSKCFDENVRGDVTDNILEARSDSYTGNFDTGQLLLVLSTEFMAKL